MDMLSVHCDSKVKDTEVNMIVRFLPPWSLPLSERCSPNTTEQPRIINTALRDREDRDGLCLEAWDAKDDTKGLLRM